MREAEILTQNLELSLPTIEELLASIEAMNEVDRAQVSPEWLARAKAATAADPWLHGFNVIHRESRTVVGSCGFTGPPDADGVVEIAYSISPAYQGRGYATEVAQAMAVYAFRTGRAKVVRAHTLPHENASTRVLSKCAFDFLGEVMDPQDGRVWRWELRAGDTHARHT
ncbi:MAG: GNAT family N-acetyltransferase [Gemmatimonadetes bacterium]|nr:GNAT family N-acetyltransferase [Gemmatimonadota bacterium]